MTYRALDKATSYTTKLDQCVFEWAAGEVGKLTVKQVSECCNMPLTHNLRRRLENFAQLGLLVQTSEYDENKRWRLFYEPHPDYRATARMNKEPF